jgi:hypothetical protein
MWLCQEYRHGKARTESKIDFEIIENAFKTLLQSHPDPATTDKITDLGNMFQDAHTGWLEIYNEAV